MQQRPGVNGRVISAAININYTSTTKQMWEENMLWGSTLESSLVVLCEAIRIKNKRTVRHKDTSVSEFRRSQRKVNKLSVSAEQS